MGSRIHDVVSVVHLCKFKAGDNIRPLPVVVDNVEEWEVEKIEGERLSQGAVEFLVKWKGYGAQDHTWESMAHLEHAQEALLDWRASQDEVKVMERSKTNRKSHSPIVTPPMESYIPPSEANTSRITRSRAKRIAHDDVSK